MGVAIDAFLKPESIVVVHFTGKDLPSVAKVIGHDELGVILEILHPAGFLPQPGDKCRAGFFFWSQLAVIRLPRKADSTLITGESTDAES